MLSKTMTILLGIINRRPVNAYELNKWLTKMNVRQWYNIASSTVYATLKAAEKKMYIAGSVEKSGNMPDKTIYNITEKGRDELLKTIRNCLDDFDYDITTFHIGMFFADAIGQQETLSLLTGRAILLKKYEQGLAEQIKKMTDEGLPELIILNVKQNLYIVQAQRKGTEEILDCLAKDVCV